MHDLAVRIFLLHELGDSSFKKTGKVSSFRLQQLKAVLERLLIQMIIMEMLEASLGIIIYVN